MNAYVREYRKIEDRTRRRDNFVLRYLPILLLVAGAVVVAKIYTQSIEIRWSRQVMEEKQAARDLDLQNQDLRRTLASLSTRERVTHDAGRRLGMVAPREKDVVWLPVVERSPDRPAPVVARSEATPTSLVRAWFDGLWQKEALALTSR